MSHEKPRVGLLGGSFNPVHIGHLRLCLEMLEQAGLDRVELVPTYIPPHKAPEGILPFEMRVSMLQSCTWETSGLEVNLIERERPGPSYTLDTLKTYMHANPGHEINFILGDTDLFTLPKWHHGRDIACLSNLLVIGREGGQSRVDAFIKEFLGASIQEGNSWLLENGRRISFYCIPRLDISSSMIRDRWLARKSIDWLVPATVKDILAGSSGKVRSVWEQGYQSGSRGCKPAYCR
ncbi:nicotinate (nicotinamide) nucleotide adenylyltransferase [Desulfonatronospira sp.]|uniref:nicotinate (nicotinamide) nucleotide adenylyltransferase n=1 Tax=Desulfonatronospira sp. TaxID=1962951 RepID=UPI0025C5AA4E|nr:nicotinate (nicotinamide) nucleotide adenylyltransferase [Desulfonatronospira sp.]